MPTGSVPGLTRQRMARRHFLPVVGVCAVTCCSAVSCSTTMDYRVSLDLLEEPQFCASPSCDRKPCHSPPKDPLGVVALHQLHSTSDRAALTPSERSTPKTRPSWTRRSDHVVDAACTDRRACARFAASRRLAVSGLSEKSRERDPPGTFDLGLACGIECGNRRRS